MHFARLSIRVTLLVMTIALIVNGGLAFAQGSAGGSIGNDEKSISGTRPEPASHEATPNSRSERKTRRSSSTDPNAHAGKAGCVLVRMQTSTPGCYGYVGYSRGVRVGWLRRKGMWVRSGSGEKCREGGVSATLIGADAVRMEDGTRMRLDAGCNNGQDY